MPVVVVTLVALNDASNWTAQSEVKVTVCDCVERLEDPSTI